MIRHRPENSAIIFFRPGICGDIVIMHRKVEQSVTDTSADEERFMMMFIQDAQHLAHRHRDIVEVSHADKSQIMGNKRVERVSR